jgi:hypothetical protein
MHALLVASLMNASRHLASLLETEATSFGCHSGDFDNMPHLLSGLVYYQHFGELAVDCHGRMEMLKNLEVAPQLDYDQDWEQEMAWNCRT